MIIAADYPFLDILGTMLVVFLWVMWFWCLIAVLSDVFGRRDIGGWAKAGWTAVLIFVPVISMLVYLIVSGRDMAERRAEGIARAQTQFDDHIRDVSSSARAERGPSGEIARGKQLLDSGAIDAREFEQLKRRALAT